MASELDQILDAAFKAAGVTAGKAVSAKERLRRAARLGVQKPVLQINSPAWRQQVSERLLDGYGVEDIAIWLGCHVSHCRAEVQRLREAGRLAAWWGRA